MKTIDFFFSLLYNRAVVIPLRGKIMFCTNCKEMRVHVIAILSDDSSLGRFSSPDRYSRCNTCGLLVDRKLHHADVTNREGNYAFQPEHRGSVEWRPLNSESGANTNCLNRKKCKICNAPLLGGAHNQISLPRPFCAPQAVWGLPCSQCGLVHFRDNGQPVWDQTKNQMLYACSGGVEWVEVTISDGEEDNWESGLHDVEDLGDLESSVRT